MSIDVVYLLLLFLALLKGLQRGMVMAVFSLVGYVVGLAAALKLSAAVANRLGQSLLVSSHWLPFVSFVLVFFAAMLLIRLVAKILETSLEMAFLGWLNKAGGVVFYMVNYTVVYSILLFFLVKLSWVSGKTIQDSITYRFIEPWGPAVINGIGKWIPAFRDVFHDLEHFFEHISRKISSGI